MWCAVLFPRESRTAPVPHAWIFEENNILKTWWPPYKTDEKINAAVLNFEEPNQSRWETYPVKVLGCREGYDSLIRARQKCNKALENFDHDDINSSEAGQRKLLAKRKVCHDSSDDDTVRPTSKLTRLPTPPPTKTCLKQQKKTLEPLKRKPLKKPSTVNVKNGSLKSPNLMDGKPLKKPSNVDVKNGSPSLIEPVPKKVPDDDHDDHLSLFSESVSVSSSCSNDDMPLLDGRCSNLPNKDLLNCTPTESSSYCPSSHHATTFDTPPIEDLSQKRDSSPQVNHSRLDTPRIEDFSPTRCSSPHSFLRLDTQTEDDNSRRSAPQAHHNTRPDTFRTEDDNCRRTASQVHHSTRPDTFRTEDDNCRRSASQATQAHYGTRPDTFRTEDDNCKRSASQVHHSTRPDTFRTEDDNSRRSASQATRAHYGTRPDTFRTEDDNCRRSASQAHHSTRPNTFRTEDGNWKRSASQAHHSTRPDTSRTEDGNWKRSAPQAKCSMSEHSSSSQNRSASPSQNFNESRSVARPNKRPNCRKSNYFVENVTKRLTTPGNDFKEAVTYALIKIATEIERLGDMLSSNTTLNNRPLDVADNDMQDALLELQNFPLTSQQELQAIEEKLQTDKKFKSKLIKETSRIGGSTTNETIKRILRRLLTDKLAAQYSWVGFKKKLVFSTLQIKDVLFASVRAQVMTTHPSTEHEMETAVKEWLRHAPHRAKSKNDIGLQAVQDEEDVLSENGVEGPILE